MLPRLWQQRATRAVGGSSEPSSVAECGLWQNFICRAAQTILLLMLRINATRPKSGQKVRE
jgi:hypothetical protein